MSFVIPQHIIIHHSLTKDSETVSWQAIRNYHVNTLGWNEIGYHYGIEMVNTQYEILVGRMEDAIGAHTIGRNLDSISICCIGNYDNNPPDEAMYHTLINLCLSICSRYRISIENVKGHNYHAPHKTCPGKAFPLVKLQDELRSLLRYRH